MRRPLVGHRPALGSLLQPLAQLLLPRLQQVEPRRQLQHGPILLRHMFLQKRVTKLQGVEPGAVFVGHASDIAGRRATGNPATAPSPLTPATAPPPPPR